jgi:hypothetical protein
MKSAPNFNILSNLYHFYTCETPTQKFTEPSHNERTKDKYQKTAFLFPKTSPLEYKLCGDKNVPNRTLPTTTPLWVLFFERF